MIALTVVLEGRFVADTRPRLREYREARGWAQQDVAEQLARVAWLRHGKHVAVNADMVSKWERGVKRPSRYYRELLRELFDAEESALGIARERATDLPVADGSLSAIFKETKSLLDQFGPAGAILRSQMFVLREDEVMQRRALLKVVGLSTATGLAAGTGGPERRPSKITPEAVADLEELAGRYQSLYHSTSPAVLMAPVVAHLDIVRNLLRDGGPYPLRRRLLANQAWVAMLAGRLSFFDCGDPIVGRGYFNLALDSACDAGDHLQGAVAMWGVARIAEDDRRFGPALDCLHAAARQVDKNPDSRVSSWLFAVESQTQAKAGAHTAALAAVDHARDVIAQPARAGDLPWFHNLYDPSGQDHYAGFAALQAGRLDESCASLTEAVGKLPSTDRKRRAVFMTDLATAQLARGDLDQACQTASEAVGQLDKAACALGFGRLREFRSSVQRWSGSPSVRELDERLAVLA